VEENLAVLITIKKFTGPLMWQFYFYGNNLKAINKEVIKLVYSSGTTESHESNKKNNLDLWVCFWCFDVITVAVVSE
jgi:hypothetical protein